MLNNQAKEMLLSVLGVLMVKFILQAVALDEMKIESEIFLILYRPQLVHQQIFSKLSVHYPHKTSYFFIMRIKQMIIHSNLSKTKNKILPT